MTFDSQQPRYDGSGNQEVGSCMICLAKQVLTDTSRQADM